MASKAMQAYLTSKGLLSNNRGIGKEKTQKTNYDEPLPDNYVDPLESFLELPMKKYGGMYLISKEGQIYSRYSDKVLKNNLDRHGYLYVILTDVDKGHHREATHILVAKTYIPNPDNLPVVDHVNGNKQCPNVNNLEWVTQAENTQRAYDTGLTRRDVYLIAQIDNELNQIQVFDSVKELSEKYPEYKINGVRIACRKNTLYKGYYWKYVGKDE